MTALSPLLLAIFMGCTAEQTPDSGVFVGNPGKLELTAARSSDYQLSGFILLDELVLGACGSQQSLTTSLEERELTLVDDGTLRFELDEPLQIPPGAWCRMELILSTASLTAEGLGGDGSDRSFQLDFDDVSIAVSGAEFVVDDQLLALELAEPDWLGPLAEVLAEDPSAIDVASLAPEIHAVLRAALEQRSALYILDPGRSEDVDQTPPGAANGELPLWSGDEREPEPTEPTEPTDTGTFPPPQVDLQIDVELPLQAALLDVGTPVFFGDFAYLPVTTADSGSFVFPVQDYGYDPGAMSIQPEASEVALTTDGQQLYLLSTTPAGAAVDTLSVDALDSVATVPFPGAARRPAAGQLVSGPVTTWLDGDQLQFAYATDDQTVPLAEGVVDYDLATDGSDGMLISWIEPVTNPIAPDGASAHFTAFLANDRTVLFDGAVSGDLTQPRVALAGSRAVVARLDGAELVADIYGVDGIRQVPLSLATDRVDAYDIAMVADLVMVAWSGPTELQLQLFDAVSGLPLTEAVRSNSGSATEVVVALQGDAPLRFTVAARGPDGGWVLQGSSEDALLP